MSKPWREYKWNPELFDFYLSLQKRTPYPGKNYFPAALELKQYLLARPIFRVMSLYPSYGLSPFALGRLTLQEPAEVWKQIQKENINTLSYCSTTFLPVVNTFRPYIVNQNFWAGQDGSYEAQWRRACFHAEQRGKPTIADLMARFPLKKCKLSFDLSDGKTFKISKPLVKILRDAYYLGLKTEADASEYLL